MSLSELKLRAADLELSEQRELIAYLIARQTARNEEFKRTLARKIDDNDPTHWIELDELRRRDSE